MTRRPWTSQDIATLRRLYANTPTKELAEHFGRSLGSVYDDGAAVRAGEIRRGDG